MAGKTILFYLTILLLIFIPLYPKFPLLGVGGTFVSVRLEDFLVASVVVVWGIISLKNKFLDLKLPVQKSIVLYLVIGFIAIFSGIFLTKTATLSLGLLHTVRRVEYMLVFMAAYLSLRHKDDLNFVVKVLLIVSLLVAIYGLGQQFLNWPIISTTNSEFSKGLALTLGPGARINSTFAGHYDLAAFSVFPLLLIAALMSLSQVRHKWFLLLIGSLVYWAMLLSASRVTFVAFYMTAGLFLLLIRKIKWLIPLFVLGITSLFFSPQLLGRYQEFLINHVHAQEAVDQQLPDALKPAAAPEDRSFNIRINAEWPRALRSFWENPILGTGFSSVGLAVDNDYLRILAETGFWGLLAFGLIILRIFKSSRAFFKAPQTISEAFVIATTLGLGGLLLNAVFIDVFEASKIAIITWTLLGLSERVKSLV